MCFLPSQVCKASHEKKAHMNTHFPMTEQLRGLISSSHFEKLYDRDLCSSRVPKAACCRSRVYVNACRSAVCLQEPRSCVVSSAAACQAVAV